ncbi:cadherin-like domain-containing protein, partial [Pseudoalteromonas sp. Z9A5]|uniref:Ig-like domain-containing protein n=1 Tax=Pseudoalteromonas sp. Z9A5 TaxID=2686355 RepID=UPI001981C740
TITGVGELIINADGTFTFTPAADYNGPVPSATYTAIDANGSTNTATLSFNDVSPVNDTPIAANDGPFTVTEDTPVNGNVLINDTDADGDNLTVSQFVIDGSATVYTAGDTATIAGVGELIINADGTFTFTPAADYNGPVPSATYTITDNNGGTDTAILSFNDVSPVNDAPIAINDSITTIEGTPINIDVLGNDTDIDDESLSIKTIAGQEIVIGLPITLSDGTIIELNQDRTLTITPPQGFNGTISLDYTVSDINGEISTATINLTVTAMPAGVDINSIVQIGQQYNSSNTSDISNTGSDNKDRDERLISAPGVVLQTIFDVRDLHSSANLNVSAPILTAINDMQNLNSMSSHLNMNHPILDAMRALDQFSIFNQHLTGIFGVDYEPFDTNEINTFSLILSIGGDDILYNNELTVETIVRDSAIIMSLHTRLIESESSDVKYNITRVDGRALSDWISVDSKGLVLIEPPVKTDVIQLKIHAEDINGSSITYPIEVDFISGSVTKIDTSDKASTDTFDNRIAQEAYSNTVEVTALIQALDTTKFQ